MGVYNMSIFKSGIILKKTDNDYILELWGASTKHPDSVFRYSEWENKSEYFEDKYQIYQWLLNCASRLSFPFHAKNLVDYANEHWYNWL